MTTIPGTNNLLNETIAQAPVVSQSPVPVPATQRTEQSDSSEKKADSVYNSIHNITPPNAPATAGKDKITKLDKNALLCLAQFLNASEADKTQRLCKALQNKKEIFLQGCANSLAKYEIKKCLRQDNGSFPKS